MVKKRMQTLRRIWADRLAVEVYQEYEKPNSATGHEGLTVIKNEPCRLSFSALHTVNQSDGAATVSQVAKIFCCNELSIPAGSKIIVTSAERGGRVFEFSQSGKPGVYSYHQEIALVPFRGWA